MNTAPQKEIQFSVIPLRSIFDNPAFQYFSELLVLIFILAAVALLLFALQELTRKRIFNKWIVLLACSVIFMIYFDANESIFKGGEHLQYYENGAVKSRGVFVQGVRQGTHRFYYENGALASEWFYQNNKAEGTAKAFYESGELKTLAPYEDGKRQGTAQTFYQTGELMAESLFKNDILLSRKIYGLNGGLVYEEYFQGSETE